MSDTSVFSPPNERPRGRVYLWAGILLCPLALGLAAAQFQLKYLVVPWYTPALTTLGTFLLLLSVARRRSILRVGSLLLVGALAAFEWYFLVWAMKLPDYHGPADTGKPFPAFTTTLADGTSFTDANLRDGTRRVLTFFRGRW
jgi:hypothetical protein